MLAMENYRGLNRIWSRSKNIISTKRELDRKKYLVSTKKKIVKTTVGSLELNNEHGVCQVLKSTQWELCEEL